MAGVSPDGPAEPGRASSHAIVGTVIEVGIAVVVSVPLGIGTAVYMTEVGGRGSQLVRTVVEAMTALPEILAGLFVYVVLIVGFGLPKSGLAVSVAMAVTMMPIIARAGEVALRVVPERAPRGEQRAGGHPLEDRPQGGAPERPGRPGHRHHPGRGPGDRRDGHPAHHLGGFELSRRSTRSQADELAATLHLHGYTTHEPVAITRGFGAASVLLTMVLIAVRGDSPAASATRESRQVSRNFMRRWSRR